MRSLRLTRRAITATILFALTVLTSSAVAGGTAATDKIPVTTSSPEARELYLKGRELAEKLRATDARKFYEQAVAKDPNFALAMPIAFSTSWTRPRRPSGSTCS